MIPYTTIPFVSAFFLMLVGVLIGQMFWSRFRGQHQRIVSRLRRQVRLMRQELKLSSSQRDEYGQQAAASGRIVEEQESEIAQLRRQIRTQRDDHEESTSRLAQETQARRDLAACLADEQTGRAADVSRLHGKLQESERRFAGHRDRDVASDAKIATLEQSNDAVQHKLAELESQNRSLTEQLDQKRTNHEQLDAALVRAKGRLDEERREIDRLARVEDQLVEIDAEFRQAKSELKRMRQQRDDAIQVEAATRQIVTELRDELNDRLASVETLTREKEITENQLVFEQRQRKQVDDALEQSEARMATLQNENDGWSRRQAKMVAQAAELSEQVQHWQARASESEQRSQRAERQVAELASQLDCHAELADETREQLSNRPDDQRSPEQRGEFSFRDMRVREQWPQDEDDQELILDPRLGNIYVHAPQTRDDLKKISGIADRLEEQLNLLGVFTYHQVMEWDQTAITEVSRRLDLGDTIQSNDWVGKARRLHQDNERNAA